MEVPISRDKRNEWIMGMEIDTFCLTAVTKKQCAMIRDCPSLNKVDMAVGSCPFANLKKAVSWACENNVDAILVTDRGFTVSGHEFNKIFRTIHRLYADGICLFALGNAKGGKQILPVSDGLCLTNKWKTESGWIILRPLFPVIRQFDIHSLRTSSRREPVLADLCNMLEPTKFIFTKNTTYKYKQARVNVVVPFRNIQTYISACVQSIERQRYRNYRVFFIDDCSDDDSSDRIPDNRRFFKMKNDSRKHALKNIADLLRKAKFNKNDVICIVDGDDKLCHPYVFRAINQVYSSGDVEITHGSFRCFGRSECLGKGYTRKEFKNIRKAAWKASHLKTFRYSLFKRYLHLDTDMSHLKDTNGEFLKMPYDMAIMFPLLEIAGRERTRFLDVPLYLYRLHEDNDHHSHRELQLLGETVVRGKRPLRAS